MQRKLRFFLLLLLLAGAGVMRAQHPEVVEFRADLSMTDAVKYPKYDSKDQPCGLIKLGFASFDANFEGDIVSFDFKDGEWWIYMDKGADYLRIISKENAYEPILCEFLDYGIKGVESNVTYVMNVDLYYVSWREGWPEMGVDFISILGLSLGSQTSFSMELYGKSRFMFSGALGIFPVLCEDFSYGVFDELVPYVELALGWQMLKGKGLRITPQVGFDCYFDGEFVDFTVCPKVNLSYPVTRSFVIGITPMYCNMLSLYGEFDPSLGVSLTLGWQLAM